MRRHSLLPAAQNHNVLESTLTSNLPVNDSHLELSVLDCKVVPLTTPRIIRKCARCKNDKFASSDKFRVNANKKLIDVWLIYKCTFCHSTFNCTILSRTIVSKIDSVLLTKFHENDFELAWQYALDGNLLQGLILDWDLEFEIQCNEELDFSPLNLIERKIRVSCDYYLKIPVFSVLRHWMKISRSQLDKLYKEGKIRVYNLNHERLDLKSSIGKICMVELG